ncbi:fimbrial biogenesis chaperone [Pseudomonas putida]|uniref:fimbrial biogenesis chaperone n=1 Tax=Pseudomonas putida TaxID=303 RepID=UPI000377C3EC|nr:molecular chaperone [Pseudomonas putida]
MKTMMFAKVALLGALTSFNSLANAGIMLGGTRVLYTEPTKEASIMVMNQGAQDIMIQSWIEPEVKDGVQNVPFVITPALSRLGGNKQQLLRIFYSGEHLPGDKESLFRLNVQEIPQKSKDENSLQIAVRQRLKLFYRPASLVGKPDEAPKQLHWRLVEQSGKAAVEVRNPSAFHVSFASVTLHNGSVSYPVSAGMIAPGKTQVFNVQGLPASKMVKPTTIEFNSINDYGGHDNHSIKLSQ